MLSRDLPAGHFLAPVCNLHSAGGSRPELSSISLGVSGEYALPARGTFVVPTKPRSLPSELQRLH